MRCCDLPLPPVHSALMAKVWEVRRAWPHLPSPVFSHLALNDGRVAVPPAEAASDRLHQLPSTVANLKGLWAGVCMWVQPALVVS